MIRHFGYQIYLLPYYHDRVFNWTESPNVALVCHLRFVDTLIHFLKAKPKTEIDGPEILRIKIF